MKTKNRCLGLNIIAPGIGQYGMKCWIRGTVYLISSLVMLLWATWAVLYPLFYNVYMLLRNDSGTMIKIRFIQLLIAITLFFGIWIISFIDIIRNQKT